jgi:hypothetical protein
MFLFKLFKPFVKRTALIPIEGSDPVTEGGGGESMTQLLYQFFFC